MTQWLTWNRRCHLVHSKQTIHGRRVKVLPAWFDLEFPSITKNIYQLPNLEKIHLYSTRTVRTYT